MSYRQIELERSGGIVCARYHSDGGPFRWSGAAAQEIASLYDELAADPEVHVLIVTGTGDRFCTEVDTGEAGVRRNRRQGWDFSALAQTISQGFDRIMPWMAAMGRGPAVIAAVNGPVTVHSDLVVTADIVLCTPDTVFQDAVHFETGGVPGDGVNVIWQALLGPNRGRYFLLTAQQLGAAEALNLGVVAEVVPRESLLDRAWELAEHLSMRGGPTLRLSKLALNRHYRQLFFDGHEYGMAMQWLAFAARAQQTPDDPRKRSESDG